MPKVALAMSGGVDSSVAAVLLIKQGFDVTGMMLRLWSEPGKEDSNRCCTPDSMAQARRVAARLDIPFYVIDAKEIFWEKVVSSFLDGYAAGDTPNPCLVCNRLIRWEFLLEHALALGVDFMATGHYARSKILPDGRRLLLKGNDPAKDQSYVLHVLTQEKLSRAMFPVGDYTKPEIRQIAEENGLSVARRPDSQDLCFLAGENYRNFLLRYRPAAFQKGAILDSTGRVLGEHSGLPNYTIGQRKGLDISSTVPLYVLEKDGINNTLIVGTFQDLGKTGLSAVDFNWTCGKIEKEPFRAEIKTRYTAQAAPGWVMPESDPTRVSIQFDSPQRDITNGQAAVVYAGDVVIGGGMIVKSR